MLKCVSLWTQKGKHTLLPYSTYCLDHQLILQDENSLITYICGPDFLQKYTFIPLCFNNSPSNPKQITFWILQIVLLLVKLAGCYREIIYLFMEFTLNVRNILCYNLNEYQMCENIFSHFKFYNRTILKKFMKTPF